MSSLELKLPPPVVALAVGLLMSGLAACDFGPLPLSAVWRHVGAAALFGLGLALLLVSGRLFLKARTTWRPHAPEKARIENIGIGNYSFRNAANANSYRDSLFFLTRVKSEAYQRYSDGRISKYRFSDTVGELETLAYSLDNYFASLSSFERT